MFRVLVSGLAQHHELIRVPNMAKARDTARYKAVLMLETTTDKYGSRANVTLSESVDRMAYHICLNGDIAYMVAIL